MGRDTDIVQARRSGGWPSGSGGTTWRPRQLYTCTISEKFFGRNGLFCNNVYCVL